MHTHTHTRTQQNRFQPPYREEEKTKEKTPLRNGGILETFGQLHEKVNNEPLVLDAVPEDGAAADVGVGLFVRGQPEWFGLPDILHEIFPQKPINLIAKCLQFGPSLDKGRFVGALFVQRVNVVLHAKTAMKLG